MKSVERGGEEMMEEDNGSGLVKDRDRCIRIKLYNCEASTSASQNQKPPLRHARFQKCNDERPPGYNALSRLSSKHGRDDNDCQNNGQHQQQTASLSPCGFLVFACTSQLYIRLLRIASHIDHVPMDRVKLRALLVNDMRHVSEELVEFPHRLFNVPDLGFALHNQ